MTKKTPFQSQIHFNCITQYQEQEKE